VLRSALPLWSSEGLDKGEEPGSPSDDGDQRRGARQRWRPALVLVSQLEAMREELQWSIADRQKRERRHGVRGQSKTSGSFGDTPETNLRSKQSYGRCSAQRAPCGKRRFPLIYRSVIGVLASVKRSGNRAKDDVHLEEA